MAFSFTSFVHEGWVEKRSKYLSILMNDPLGMTLNVKVGINGPPKVHNQKTIP